MRITKRDFFKLIGLGAAGAPLTKAHTESHTPELQDIPSPGVDPFGPLPRRDDYTSQMFSIVDRMLYDRIHFRGRLPHRFRMFTTGIGQPCEYTHKTKWHDRTNLYMAGRLPAPEMFWIRRIHIMVDREACPQDLKVLDTFAWKFRIMQKSFADGPVLPDVRKISGMREITELGHRATRQSLELHASKGLFIPRMAYFNAEFESAAEGFQLELDPKGPGIDIMMGLEGVEARGVQ